MQLTNILLFYNKIDRRGAVYFVQKGYWDEIIRGDNLNTIIT